VLFAVPLGDARADTKDACAAAYEQTQVLRTAGKLLAAKKQATICASGACSEYATKDCAQWLAEIQESLPTVVFTAQDQGGADTLAVRVTLDGVVLGERLDGKAVALDPGAHIVRFELAGAPPIEQQILVAQGEHDRKIRVSFKGGGGETAPAAEERKPAPIWAWVVGGAGIVLVGVGTGFMVSALSAQHSLDQACGGNSRACPAADVATARPFATTRNTNRAVAIGTGVAGVVGIIAGAVGIASATSAPRKVGLTPMVAPSFGGLAITGSY
jgi:hypothetical protein